jgi:hypothetical protein
MNYAQANEIVAESRTLEDAGYDEQTSQNMMTARKMAARALQNYRENI